MNLQILRSSHSSLLPPTQASALFLVTSVRRRLGEPRPELDIDSDAGDPSHHSRGPRDSNGRLKDGWSCSLARSLCGVPGLDIPCGAHTRVQEVGPAIIKGRNSGRNKDPPFPESFSESPACAADMGSQGPSLRDSNAGDLSHKHRSRQGSAPFRVFPSLSESPLRVFPSHRSESFRVTTPSLSEP